jgi:hypothetical protein
MDYIMRKTIIFKGKNIVFGLFLVLFFNENSLHAQKFCIENNKDQIIGLKDGFRYELWIHFPFAYKALKLFNVFMPKYKTKINMVERIKEAKRLKSILFIYSDTDTWATTAMGKRFHENSAVLSELWTVPVAKHAMIIKLDFSEQYKQKIVAYFDHSINS